MKKEDVIAFIKDKAIDKNGILLLNYDDAKETIKLCLKNKIDVLGIDVFSLNNNTLQPHMDKSIDFSSEFCKNISPDEYFDHLDDNCKELSFEVTI